MKCRTILLVAACWALTAGPLAADVTVLDGKTTYFRWLKADRPIVFVAEPGAAERATLGSKKIPAAEALREGLQEAEALMTISETLAKPKDMPAGLADGCRKVLADDLASPARETRCDTSTSTPT